MSGDVAPQNNSAMYDFPPLFAQAPMLVMLSNTFPQLPMHPTTEQIRSAGPNRWSLTLQNASVGSETGPILTMLKLQNAGTACALHYSGDPVEVVLPSIPPKGTVVVSYVLPEWYRGCGGFGGTAWLGLDVVRAEAARAEWSGLSLRASWSVP